MSRIIYKPTCSNCGAIISGEVRDMENNVIVSFNIGKYLPPLSSLEGKDLDIKASQHRENTVKNEVIDAVRTTIQGQ